MPYPAVNTFEEACDIVDRMGILPLTSFIPDHPSLTSITNDGAWHTGMDTDPCLLIILRVLVFYEERFTWKNGFF